MDLDKANGAAEEKGAPEAAVEPSSGSGSGMMELETPSGDNAADPAAVRDDTEDPDGQLESDVFDTRQQFLNLCQVNHYQFDELRRAKHTTMMSLYHIHNPSTPKILVPCSQCSAEISSGFHYTCQACPDFHICPDCFAAGGHRHPHVLTKTATEGKQVQLTEAQRRQRLHAIQQRLRLIQHSSGCDGGPTCVAPEQCARWKEYLVHEKDCQQGWRSGCRKCQTTVHLLQLHARQCRQSNCRVPKCGVFKDKMRRIQDQQDAMNDRRRNAMNQAAT